jgi:hypothetical protein
MSFIREALMGSWCWDDGVALLHVELEIEERCCGCGLFTRIQPGVLVFVRT